MAQSRVPARGGPGSDAAPGASVQPQGDTIAAVATAPGRAGIGVVRVSGPGARAITLAMAGDLPEPRRAVLRVFRGRDGEALDQGLVIFFATPASFTGEDLVELHGHGGPVVLDLLLARVLELGARLAEPGEFSRRAFLNDRIDLAQAEAIADLIDSATTQAARAAMRSLQGEFSAQVHSLVEAVTTARMHVEAAIDFPDDDIDFLDDAVLHARLRELQQACTALVASATQGALLREGYRIVIAGKPNAGKSSLLNRLAGEDVAIVTPIAGTTRDPLREYIQLDGLPVTIVDTAGLRTSPDVIEAEGIRRAHGEMGRADRILYVIDALAAPAADTLNIELAELPQGIPVTVVLNKIDSGRDGMPVTDPYPGLEAVRISALTGEGMADLRAHLKHVAGYAGDDGSRYLARRRHLDALHRAAGHVANASRLLDERRAGELVAEELRLTQIALGEITGQTTTEDLLGRIFASFCIGK